MKRSNQPVRRILFTLLAACGLATVGCSVVARSLRDGVADFIESSTAAWLEHTFPPPEQSGGGGGG